MRLFQNQAEEGYFEIIFVFVTPLQVCRANKQEDVKTIVKISRDITIVKLVQQTTFLKHDYEKINKI